MPRYTALLDACVLVPIALADTLLRVAERELYRPLWSDRILTETAEAILDIHTDVDPDLVTKRFAAMNDTFEDACVQGWEHPLARSLVAAASAVTKPTYVWCVTPLPECSGRSSLEASPDRVFARMR